MTSFTEVMHNNEPIVYIAKFLFKYPLWNLHHKVNSNFTAFTWDLTIICIVKPLMSMLPISEKQKF